MNLPETIRPIWDFTLNFLSSIKFKRICAFFNDGLYYQLKEEDHDKIREILKENYLIILTKNNSNLSTYLVLIASFFVSKKISHYSHALMNVEGDLAGHLGYKLIEATRAGVHYSTFMEVFDCDSVAMLSPRGIPLDEWTRVLDQAKTELGKKYDTLFDLTSDQRLSCVELVYWGLKKLPDFENRFPNLIKAIQDHKNQLTPQMLYDTGELDIVFEVRR